MKNLHILFATGIILISCSKNRTDYLAQPVAIDSVSVHAKNLVIGNPVSYGEKNILLFPVGASYNPVQHKKSEPGTYTVTASVALGSSYMTDNADNVISTFNNSSGDDVDIRNLIFYNRATGESHTLGEGNFHISSFAIHRELNSPAIIYHMVNKDVNEDKKFNLYDPQVLYISNLDGSDLHRLTPEDENFVEYFFYADQQIMLLKMMRDSDTSGYFEPHDETFFRRLDLKSREEAGMILQDDIMKKLKENL